MFNLSRFIYCKLSPSHRNHTYLKYEIKHSPLWKCLSSSVGHKLNRSPTWNKYFIELKRSLIKYRETLKQDSARIVQVWTQQCECVFAHRLRRGIQFFTLYSNIWDDLALRQFVKNFKYQLSFNGKKLLLSSSIVAAFNWNDNKMADNILLDHENEMETTHELINASLICPKCHKRNIIDIMIPGIEYCSCPDGKFRPVDRWTPFIERKDILIWRREDKENVGLFTYKVYGSYDDVTARDFLQVQIDTDYRKEWDTSAVVLTIVDSDNSSNSDIIYWEMEWPRMFSNRDYVFNRRYMIDTQTKVIIIVNKITEHPSCPEKPELYRVKDYWSFMTIKPYTELEEPGLEFTLTYFDNPGISIPTAVSTWVSIRGLPEFLSNLRQAARNLDKYYEKISARKSLTKSLGKEEGRKCRPRKKTENKDEEDKKITNKTKTLMKLTHFWHLINNFRF